MEPRDREHFGGGVAANRLTTVDAAVDCSKTENSARR